MTLKEKAAVIHYLRHRIGEYTIGTAGALGYRNEDSQLRRYAALTEAGDLNGHTLLDIGCGHGDLKGYLDERYHGFGYIGIDQMPEFIMRARSMHGHRPNCYFCLADFTTEDLPHADYAFASGVFCYRCENENYYFAMIEKMYGAADKALAFNMLDAAKFPAHPLLTGHDPEKVLAYCKTLSPDVRLIRGYLEDDFTVVMHRFPSHADG